MAKSVFDISFQQKDLSSKIVVGLERVSEAFRVLLWEHAKVIGLSPIQIQLLIFIAYHKEPLCNVSHLAKEFNLTKPTVSDAIKVLETKGLIRKELSTIDSRSYSISLSNEGKKVVADTEQFANPIKQELDKVDNVPLEETYKVLHQLIFRLNRIGVLNVQRTCFGCKYYEQKGQKHFCNLLQKPLVNNEIRLDCPEFDGKVE